MKTRDKIVLTLRGYRALNELTPGLLAAVCLNCALGSLLPFINIFMSARIITAIAEKSELKQLLFLAALTAILNAVTALMQAGSRKLSNYYAHKFSIIEDKPLKDKLQAMDYALVENVETHLKLERLDVLTRTMGYGLSTLIYGARGILSGAFKVIFSVSLLATAFSSYHSKPAGAWEFIFTPVGVAVIVLLIAANLCVNCAIVRKTMRRTTLGLSGLEQMNRSGQYYYNNLLNYRFGKDLKLYELGRPIFSEFKGFNDTMIAVMDKVQRYQARNNSIIIAVNTLITGAIYVYIALKALFGAFGVGLIAQYAGSLVQLNGGVESIMEQLSWLDANTRALEMYFEFLDTPNDKYQGTLPVEKRAFCDGGDNDYEIEFKDVSFKYPAAGDYALKHVSLRLRAGERMAVVGMNGSGKTTFIKLLCRLYDPTEGEILLNGIDIKKYDYDEYMSLFSVVFQDFKLFSFPLGSNVAASVNYDRAMVDKRLAEAGYGDRPRDMGLDTYLYKDFDERGVEISGGEAQKIALARALYKDAPFIVLDEPTAALDPIAEAEVYSKFNDIVGDKTAIYISHRLASCRFLNDIAVFDRGELAQRGSHDELVSQEGGKYRELWRAQARYYAENA